MSDTRTLGEKRIRTGFNPSGQEETAAVKKIAADLIDRMEANTPSYADGETRRLLSLGHTAMEEAAIWYVKVLTSEIREVKVRTPVGDITDLPFAAEIIRNVLFNVAEGRLDHADVLELVLNGEVIASNVRTIPAGEMPVHTLPKDVVLDLIATGQSV